MNYLEDQLSSWHNKAVPLKVQKSGGWTLLYKFTGKIKLVDWPVVERTPALTDVL